MAEFLGTSFFKRPTAGWWSSVALACCLAVVGLYAAKSSMSGGVLQMIPIYQVGLAAGAVALVWSLWAVFQSSRTSSETNSRQRIALVFITLGVGTMVNSLVGMWSMGMHLNNPFSDIVVQVSGLFTYLFWTCALFSFPARRTLGERKIPWILDVVLIVAAFGAAGWFFVIAPQAQFTGPRFEFWLTFAYPLTDLIAIAAVVGAMTLGGPYRGARGLVMAAITLNVVGDAWQSIYMVTNRPQPANWIHLVWILSTVSMGLAALRIRHEGPAERARIRNCDVVCAARFARALTPMLFLAGLVILAMWGNWMRPNTIDAAGLNVGCLIAVACSLLRLGGLIKDNTVLARTLAETNAGLDELVRKRTLELEHARDHIEEQKAFLRSVIDALPNMVIAQNVDQRIVLANEAAAKFYGKTTDEFVGQHYTEIVSVTNSDVADMIQEDIDKIMAGESLIVCERDIAGADRQKHVYELVKTPVKGKSGEVEQILIVGSDITIHKEAERNLIAARDAAEQMTKIKSEFMATMSHEIRTPMNAIIGSSDLLLSEDVPPEMRETVESIRVSAENLLQIVNDILDISNLSSGQLAVVAKPTSLVSTCVDTVEPYRARAAEKGIRLRVDVHLDPEIRFLTDASRVQRILSSLVSNAIKFTEEGTVSVDVDVTRQTRDMAIVRFVIDDTGIGIPSDRIAGIFDTFRQVDNSMSRKYGGVGLGLSICRQLVLLLGGTISLESEIGKGSRFVVELPLKVSTMKDVAAPEPLGSLAGLHVLVVEDNEMNQKIVKRLLQRLECKVSIANNGLEAVEWLSDHRCDVILMDWQMPVMDGLEATRMIRSFEATVRQVPIIAVTANAMEGDREKCLAAGMDDYVPKPIRQEPLADAILRMVANRRAA